MRLMGDRDAAPAAGERMPDSCALGVEAAAAAAAAGRIGVLSSDEMLRMGAGVARP
jgi:hypothetical protein